MDDEDVLVAGAGSGWYVEGWSRTFCSVDAETSVDGSYAIMYPLSYNARDIGAGGRNVECFGGEIGVERQVFWLECAIKRWMTGAACSGRGSRLIESIESTPK